MLLPAKEKRPDVVTTETIEMDHKHQWVCPRCKFLEGHPNEGTVPLQSADVRAPPNWVHASVGRVPCSTAEELAL
jgi:hypothetical protein